MPEETRFNNPVIKKDAVKNNKGSKATVIILAVLLIVVVIVCVVLAKDRVGNSDANSAKETAKVVKEVGKLMELPSDETPSMATVLDVTKLADQPFFANAQDGDKLLLYTGAKKAILYRPSNNQIIEVMPLILDTSAQTAAPTGTELAQ